jgi:hypothetical protein
MERRTGEAGSYGLGIGVSTKKDRNERNNARAQDRLGMRRRGDTA